MIGLDGKRAKRIPGGRLNAKSRPTTGTATNARFGENPALKECTYEEPVCFSLEFPCFFSFPSFPVETENPIQGSSNGRTYIE